MAWTRGGPTRTSTTAHRRWRTTVLTRDRYTCQHCGHRGTPGDGTIEADHILNVRRGGHPHDPNNGQALCTHCHTIKTHTEAAAGRAAKSTRRPPQPHPGLLP